MTVERARIALALAVAHQQEERRRADTLAVRIADLEERAISALHAERSDLARDAAEMVARLEAELVGTKRATDGFAVEIERLGAIVADSETRLRDLRRGQRLAEVADRVGRLRSTVRSETGSSLRDAEQTLGRIREHQREADAVAQALDEMDQNADPAALVRKLADVACGAPVPNSTEEVLKRLEARLRPTQA